MGRKYTDNARTTLAGAIAAGATTLTVAAGKGDLFPQVTGAGTPGATPNWYVIKLKNAAGAIEKVRVEHRAAASDVMGSAGFPLVRGYDGTVALAWGVGDSVSLTVERVAAQGWEDDANAGTLTRAFGYKDSTTVGLTFGYYGGLVFSAGALTTIADGTVALTASQTNFVERTVAGVVSANTAAFTAGRIPLYTVVTSATAITAITEKRSSLMQDKDGGLTVTSVVTPLVTSAASLLIQTPGGGNFEFSSGTGTIRANSDNTHVFGDATHRWISVFTAGVSFPATQIPSADANTLDDYEEGTWTPTVGGTATYTNQLATYVKIGAVVLVTCRLAINVIGTGNNRIISGLPFTASSSFAASATNTLALATAVVSLSPAISGSTIQVNSRTAANVTEGTSAVLGSGTSIDLTGTYA